MVEIQLNRSTIPPGREDGGWWPGEHAHAWDLPRSAARTDQRNIGVARWSVSDGVSAGNRENRSPGDGAWNWATPVQAQDEPDPPPGLAPHHLHPAQVLPPRWLMQSLAVTRWEDWFNGTVAWPIAADDTYQDDHAVASAVDYVANRTDPGTALALGAQLCISRARERARRARADYLRPSCFVPDGQRARELTWQLFDADPACCDGYLEVPAYKRVRFPYSGQPRPVFEPLIGGCWPCDHLGPVPFRKRSYGGKAPMLVDVSDRVTLEQFADAGGCIGLNPAVSAWCEVDVLAEWLSLRMDCADRVKMMCVPRLTSELPDGVWVCAEMRCDGQQGADHRPHLGYHGTSLSNLARLLRQGPRPGRFGQPLEGQGVVHMYEKEVLHACSAHAVYSPLHRSGWYWAPYVQLAYSDEVGTEGYSAAVACGADLTRGHVVAYDAAVVAVYFHGVSFAHLAKPHRRKSTLWMEVKLPRKMELPMFEEDWILSTRSKNRWWRWRRRHTSALADADESDADSATSSDGASTTTSEHYSISSSAGAG